ncbi:hypothetical protein Scep_015421 [Stephania cephalantha]|uniref:Uncharacterized protein n=1 Tax=Stephania cephalantha TaxID=152367 RepID=A0AAP0J3Y5_9MAGN
MASQCSIHRTLDAGYHLHGEGATDAAKNLSNVELTSCTSGASAGRNITFFR